MFKEALRPALWVLDKKKQLPDFEKGCVISPLHYGDTVEIFFVEGIDGEVFINGKQFIFNEKNVFFIPPGHIHTSTYRRGGSKESDKVWSFHINIKALTYMVNIKNILLKDNHTSFNQVFRCNDYDGILQTVQAILDENRTFMSRLADLIRLFEMIAIEKDKDNQTVAYSKLAIKLINFVEDNYSSKLSVQTAADYFGYSKPYFCKWVRANTGTTFNELLNAVRINHSCIYLANGYSIAETAERCGFSDPSYFTKVFRHFRNMTPRAYVNYNKFNNE